MLSYPKLAARLRVSSGFALAAIYAVFSRPTTSSLATGLPLAFLGLLLRAWAAGHLEKNERLATSGPFAYSRNPLYLGTLTVAAGFALAGGNWWLAVLLAAYFVLVYLPVIGEEESHLRQLFPEYAEYAARVPWFMPRFHYGTRGPARFRWDLYIRNREYQALLGFLAVAAWLISKSLSY